MSTTTRPVRVYIMRHYAGETTCRREVMHERATFHRFGTDYEEFEAGPGLYPVAIVELGDGTVITPLVINIQFLDRAEPAEADPVRNPPLTH
jgi:hypothetical protein